MSIEHMSQARKVRGIDPTSKLILMLLADHCNQDGRCWPSIQLLADDVGIAPRNIQRHLRLLEDAGMFSRHERAGNSTIYFLTIPLSPASPLTPASPHPCHQRHPTPDASVTQIIIEPSKEPSEEQNARANALEDEFNLEFYPAYPRKVGKPLALKAYFKARKEASKEEILDGLSRLIESLNPKELNGQYTPHPSKWLNQQQFNDYPSRYAGKPRTLQETAIEWMREGNERDINSGNGTGDFGTSEAVSGSNLVLLPGPKR